jgi:uncharacterized protein
MTTKLLLTAMLAAFAPLGTAEAETTPYRVASVTFTETPAPITPEEMTATYTRSLAQVTYADGRVEERPLTYRTLFGVKDEVAEVKGRKYPAGQLYDRHMEPLLDPMGKPLVAETPDGNSLLQVDGRLFLVTHYEYDWLLSDGSEARTNPGWYSRSPMSMTLSDIAQGPDGALTATRVRPIDFSGVEGLWIPCFASQTPWGTHLGSEEDYDLIYSPLDPKGWPVTTAGLKAMDDLYLKGEREANPYHYGIIPEVTVKVDGSTHVVKHHAMGRGSWEQALVMPDRRTVYLGEDGSNVQFTLFIADREGDLSAGTLYTARWNQTGDAGGGSADLTWTRLGHGTDVEVKARADTLSFTEIFDAVAPEAGACPTAFTRVRAGSERDECLALKPGREHAAAFLETRRYTALLGGTTEWSKMEGVAVNPRDKRLYLAMSRIESSMRPDPAGPVDHIRVPENKAGAVYTLDLKGEVLDSKGEPIPSDWVAVNMGVESKLLGRPMAADARGNTAAVDSVANPDNLFYSEAMRTLFIGEDSGMHINNFLWAYNVDTQALTRILTLTAGAESTGLQVVANLAGHAYILSNAQHQGEFAATISADLKAQLEPLIDRFQAPVGYIGGLPGL